MLATLLGASALGDSFYLAFKLPNLLRRFFAEGSMAAAFIPIFNRLEKTTSARTEIEKKNFFALIFLFQTILLSAIIASLFFLAPFLSRFFYSLTTNRLEILTHTTLLLRIMLPYLLFISLAALTQGVLNSKQNFHAPATSPILLNIIIIITALFLLTRFLHDDKNTITIAISYAVLFGGLLQLIYLLFWIFKIGYSPFRKIAFKFLLLKRFLKLQIPIVFSSSFHQISVLLLDPIAVALETGAVSMLFYSNRLLELPLGIIGVSVNSISLPLFSRLAKKLPTTQSHKATPYNISLPIIKTMQNTCSLLILLLLPIMTVGWLYATLIVSLVFQFGEFSKMDVDRTAECFFFHLFALPFIALYRQIFQLFFAYEDTKTPMLISLIGSIATILIAWGSIQIAPKASSLAFASAISAAGILTFLLIATKKKFDLPLFSFLFKKTLLYASLLLPSLLLAGIIKYLFSHSSLYATNSLLLYKLFQLTELSIASAVLLIGYVLTLYFFQKEKMAALFLNLSAKSF